MHSIPLKVRSVFPAIMAAAAAIALGACATSPGGFALGGADVTTKVIIDSSYRPTDVAYSTADGAPVEIIGGPEIDPENVARVLSLPARFQAKEFVPIPSTAETRDLNRFVLVFGAPESVDGYDACRGDAASATDAPVVLTAFCDGENALSQGRLFSPAVLDPESAAFGAAHRRVLQQILPSSNPENRGDRIRLRG